MLGGPRSHAAGLAAGQGDVATRRHASKIRTGLTVAFLACLPLLLLAIVEGVGRAYLYLKYGVPGKTYGIWRYDATLGAQQLENGYNSLGVTNDFGFRNDEDVFTPKPPNSLRVIAYGGSTTYAYNLLTPDTWVYQLERSLRERRAGGQRDQVLNAGGVMWSIGHVYARARKDVPVLKPDYALIYSGINEPENARMLALDGKPMERLVREKRYGVFATNLPQNSWIKRDLITYKLLANFVAYPVLARFSKAGNLGH